MITRRISTIVMDDRVARVWRRNAEPDHCVSSAVDAAAALIAFVFVSQPTSTKTKELNEQISKQSKHVRRSCLR